MCMFEKGLWNCRENGENREVRYIKKREKLEKSEYTTYTYEIIKNKFNKNKFQMMV